MAFNRKEYNAKRYLEKKEEIQTRSKAWNTENKEQSKKNWEIYYQKNRDSN